MASLKSPIFIFDNPRTGSQLLNQYFAKHPQLEGTPGMISSWVWPLSVCGNERLATKLQISPEAVEADKALEVEMVGWYKEKVNVDVNMMFTFDNVRMGFEYNVNRVVGEGKIPFSREHRTSLLRQELLLELVRTGRIAQPPSNPTYIPDSIFATIRHPVIVIRHPAKVIPSYYRSQRMKQKYAISDESMRAWTLQRIGRFLYEHLASTDPIIVDGDDVMSKPRELSERLCEIWGLDFSGYQFEWEEENDLSKSFPLSEPYMKTIFYSTGIQERETKEVNVDAEQVKWEHEFGEEVAAGMRKLVDEDIEDYEYLRSKKLQV